MMDFFNIYEDDVRAEAYAKLEFPGTYYLAYRDLPEIISKHVNGKNALDFGCGTGRSTRVLKANGFDVIGVDISEHMIKKAIEIDSKGQYYQIKGDLSELQGNNYDLVLSAFTFDNISTFERKLNLFKQLEILINDDGTIINLVSSPEIYMNEWASFTTSDFPENKYAKNGDKVKIVMKDVDDKRPVEDIIWFEENYKDVFTKAGLEVVEIYKPLAKVEEPFNWINETRISPWTIYVLKRRFK